MPTVPVLDENQIAPTPIAAQPRQAADFGAAGEMVGNAVANFGRQASGAVDAVDRIDQIYDDAGTKRSATQYSVAAQDTLHGQNGYLAQQGIDALNTKGDTIKALTDTRDKLIGQATNPRMKRMMTDSIGVLYLAAMMTHYNGDPAKAWAAYNWGPGRVDKVLASNRGDWFSKLRETIIRKRGDATAFYGREAATAAWAAMVDHLVGHALQLHELGTEDWSAMYHDDLQR